MYTEMFARILKSLHGHFTNTIGELDTLFYYVLLSSTDTILTVCQLPHPILRYYMYRIRICHYSIILHTYSDHTPHIPFYKSLHVSVTVLHTCVHIHCSVCSSQQQLSFTSWSPLPCPPIIASVGERESLVIVQMACLFLS